jgi:hypothetical protein
VITPGKYDGTNQFGVIFLKNHDKLPPRIAPFFKVKD